MFFRLNICLKLIPMMGISWFLEIVSTILGENSSSFVPAVLDFFTSIQGAIIFVVFVCNRNVLRMLSKEYCLVLYNKYFATNNDESTKTKETELKSRSECPVESVKNETTTTHLRAWKILILKWRHSRWVLSTTINNAFSVDQSQQLTPHSSGLLLLCTMGQSYQFSTFRDLFHPNDILLFSLLGYQSKIYNLIICSGFLWVYVHKYTIFITTWIII